MGGFGRKGLAGEGGSSVSEGLRNTTRPGLGGFPVSSGQDDLARKREAFLASERARKAESPGGMVSDVAARLPQSSSRPERSLFMAYLLWFILGQVSAHRFYLGAFRSALVQVGLFAFWLTLALSTPEGSINAVGPVLAIVVIGWILWLLSDVFFIHRIHRKLCRKPGEPELAAAFA